MFIGSELGVVEGKYQPMKIAAAEALWTTCPSHCSFSLFQIGGGKNDETPTQILEVPDLLSILATNHVDGEVQGLNNLQAQYEQQYGPGDYVPNVFIQYWGMRVMAYLAALIMLFALWGLWLVRRKTLETIPAVPARRALGGDPAVPDEHRGLAAHRERSPTLDRAGVDDHRAGRLPVGVGHRHLDQPDRLRLLYAALGVADGYLMIHYGRKDLAAGAEEHDGGDDGAADDAESNQVLAHH